MEQAGAARWCQVTDFQLSNLGSTQSNMIQQEKDHLEQVAGFLLPGHRFTIFKSRVINLEQAGAAWWCQVTDFVQLRCRRFLHQDQPSTPPFPTRRHPVPTDKNSPVPNFAFGENVENKHENQEVDTVRVFTEWTLDRMK